MANTSHPSIVCPMCGKRFPVAVHDFISAEENPDLRASLLDGSLFTAGCPYCADVVDLFYPCMYRDEKHRYFVYLTDEEEGRHIFDSLPPSVVRHRVVSDANQMREKIVLFDAGLDDRAVEVMKLMRLESLRTRNPGIPIQALYYDPQDGFAVYGEDEKLGTIRFDPKLYEAVEEQIIGRLEDTFPEQVIIDADWARQVYKPGAMFLRMI